MRGSENWRGPRNACQENVFDSCSSRNNVQNSWMSRRANLCLWVMVSARTWFVPSFEINYWVNVTGKVHEECVQLPWLAARSRSAFQKQEPAPIGQEQRPQEFDVVPVTTIEACIECSLRTIVPRSCCLLIRGVCPYLSLDWRQRRKTKLKAGSRKDSVMPHFRGYDSETNYGAPDCGESWDRAKGICVAALRCRCRGTGHYVWLFETVACIKMQCCSSWGII